LGDQLRRVTGRATRPEKTDWICEEQLARLARYARAAASQLDAEEDGALMAGTVTFPNPEAFAHA